MSNETGNNLQMNNENVKNNRVEKGTSGSESSKSTAADAAMEGTDDFEEHFSQNSTAYNMIEMRPDSSYINAQFERFINVDNPFRMVKIALSDRGFICGSYMKLIQFFSFINKTV